jgi:hypothetical protein
MGDLTTCELDAKFAELVYADPDWLRNEFDALISANFGVPPTWQRPPAPPCVPPQGSPAGPPTRLGSDARTAAPCAFIALRVRRRQRSPPQAWLA